MVTINSAEGNRASIRYIKEAVWGETPANGLTYEARILKSSLTRAKTTQVSKEIRADRMVPNIQETGASAGGNINFEFSAGSLDPFLEGFLLGSFSKVMNFFQVKGQGLTLAANTVTVLGKDVRAYLAVNQYLKLEGWKTAANNTYAKIASMAFSGGNTVITTTGATLVTESGSAFSKVLDAGDMILKSTTLVTQAGNKIHDGTNAFTAGLVPGQKLWFEGLGKEVGTITVDATDPPAGSTVELSDGVDTVIFEINVSAAACAPGNVFVLLSGTPLTQLNALVAAIEGQFAAGVLKISAVGDGTSAATLTNHLAIAGSITCSDEGVSLTSVDFAGGDASLLGIVTVLSVGDANTVTVAETLSVNTNSGTLPVVVKGSHLQNPDAANIVKQSFSIETGFTDVSKFFLATGQRVGSFDLDVKAGDLVTGSVDLKGRSIVQSNTETLGLTPFTPLDSTSTEILNATSNVGSIKYQGVVLDLAIMEISLKGDSNLREQRAVGERFPAGIGYGRFNLTGKFTAYFESFELYEAFINHTTVALGFDFTDVDSNHYEFQIPAVKFTADPIVPDGIDTDVMEKIDWTAQRDPVLNCMMVVDRFSSIAPFVA